MIITRTPFRVSLLGGGTDYPAWSLEHGGLVLGTAINHHAYVTVRLLPAFHSFKTRVVYSAIEAVRSHLDIQHRAVRATLEHLGLAGDDAPGLEIFHAADLPGRSGTGSSSTFVVGLVNALSRMGGKYLAPEELAYQATKIEQERLGETVGCQDQAWAAHGGVNVIRFRKRGGTVVFPLGLSAADEAALEAHLMLFFTGVQRISSEVASAYAPGLSQKTREQFAMLRLAEEGIDAVQSRDYARLGRLVDQSWRIKAGLADGVTTPQLNGLYNAARVCGAFGGKLTGAGGGGCLLLVVPQEKQANVKKALEERGCLHIPFRFEHEGSSVIFARRNAA